MDAVAGEFERLVEGTTATAPAVAVTEEALTALIAATGFVHPLFTDRDHARRSRFGATPVPGQLVLALMGGATERAGLFGEDVVALVAIDAARFVTAALPGDRLTTHVEVVARDRSRGPARGAVTVRQRCTNQRGETVATADATFLLRR